MSAISASINKTKVIIRFIRSERLLRNLSMEEIARELDISQTVYDKIEQGRIKLTLHHLATIANILGMHINDLLDTGKLSYILKDRELEF